jgi:hypothetical protein
MLDAGHSFRPVVGASSSRIWKPHNVLFSCLQSAQCSQMTSQEVPQFQLVLYLD